MRIEINEMPDSLENGNYTVAAGKYESYPDENGFMQEEKNYKYIGHFDCPFDVAKAILFLKGYDFVDLEVNHK